MIIQNSTSEHLFVDIIFDDVISVTLYVLCDVMFLRRWFSEGAGRT